MASAPGPSAVGLSSMDPGVSSCTSSSGKSGRGVGGGPVAGGCAGEWGAPVAGEGEALPVREARALGTGFLRRRRCN